MRRLISIDVLKQSISGAQNFHIGIQTVSTSQLDLHNTLNGWKDEASGEDYVLVVHRVPQPEHPEGKWFSLISPASSSK